MDNIRREVVVRATPDEVWAKSFGTPEALSSWFPDKVEGDFGPQGVFTLVWGEHRSQCRMIEFSPPSVLAFQWHPGDAYTLEDHPAGEMTTVRFVLSDDPGGTRVVLEESGFDSIDVSRRDWAYGRNHEGWDEELAKLPSGYR